MKKALSAIVLCLAFGTVANADEFDFGATHENDIKRVDNCYDFGWSRAAQNRNNNLDCSAPYRNDNTRFRRDQNRYDLRNCVIRRDSSGDRFYFCDLPRQGGGWGNTRPWPGTRIASCRDVGWSANGATRQCAAGYRNNDARFRRDQQRYNLRNCYVHTDSSGDRFYFCDLNRNRW